MSDLRSKVIRLAHEKPELRKHLLPLLKEANVYGVQVGDYFEREGNFYKVLQTKGKTTIVLQSVGAKSVDTRGQYRMLVPDPSKTTGKPFSRRVDSTGYVKGEYGSYITKWDGQPSEVLDSQFR